MKTYLEIPCPKCQRQLRIPSEYLGKRLSCKYCEHVFKPEAAASSAGPDAASAEQIAALQTQLQLTRNELTARVAEMGQAVKDAQSARLEATRLQEQMQALSNAGEKAEARHRRAVETLQEELAAAHAAAAKAAEELQSQLRRFAEDKARFDESQAEAATLRQQHEEALQLLAAAKVECERLAAAHGDLEATHHETKQTLQADLQRLTDEMQQHRHETHGERSALEMALQEARSELERRSAEAAEFQTTLEKRSAEAAEFQAALQAAEERHRQETAERKQALLATRRELQELRASAAKHGEENEQLIGENASLSSELALVREELESARGEIAALQTKVDSHHYEEDEHRQQVLAAVRATAAKLAEDVKMLELRASQAQALESRLQEAWAITTRLEGELALATAAREDMAHRLASAAAQVQQLAPLRAERDQLAEHVKALQADLAQSPSQAGASYKNAVEAAFAGVGNPSPEASIAEKMARSMADPQRSAMAKEVARLKQENVQLRQWLAQCGVLPM